MGTVLPLQRTASPLDRPVQGLSLITDARAKGLAKLGITTVRDLLLHLPRRNDDTRDVQPLRALRPGAGEQVVRARVGAITSRRSQRGILLTVARLWDEEGAEARAIWFHEQHVRDNLHDGDDVVLRGKARADRYGLTLQNPE